MSTNLHSVSAKVSATQRSRGERQSCSGL